MKARARAGAVALVTAVGTIGALAAAPAATAGGDSGVHVITRGLDGPFGLQAVHYRSGFVVAENDTGEVTRVSGTGVQHTIFNDRIPVIDNMWHGRRIRHPVQLNLHPLPPELVVAVLADFVAETSSPPADIGNYANWLVASPIPRGADAAAPHQPYSA